MSESLHSLSDQEILSVTQALSADERRFTLTLLLHLNEIERRKLHLERGYASMFDYCTAGLGYSSSAAYRRIQTARAIARFPAVRQMIERNEVNLSTVAQVSRVLNDANHETLLARIRGKSQREVEAVLSEYQPGFLLRDRVRTVVVQTPGPETQANAITAPSIFNVTPSAEPDACENSAYCHSGSEPEPGSSPGPASADDTGTSAAESGTTEASTAETRTAEVRTTETRVVLRFAVHPGFMKKLERVRSLGWHRLPAPSSLEHVLELAMDVMLEHEAPEKRAERREKRENRDNRESVATSRKVPESVPAGPPQNARYVPARVRDDVFRRDSGRCAFVAPDGQRCSATVGLQVDHVQPVALGGRSTPDNLRLMCGRHNRLLAEKLGLSRPGSGEVVAQR